MAKRKLNSKRRFSIFKKILLKENNQYWHNVVLLEKLWEKIPQCNTNTLDANEVFDIIKKEKIKIDIRSICNFFKITLNKTSGKKFVTFNENNNLIINYCNENDIFYFLGHIFRNFLDGAYFKYPFKKHAWDLKYREQMAKKFAKQLKLLLKEHKFDSILKQCFEIIDRVNKHSETIDRVKEYISQKNNSIKRQYSDINKTLNENIKYNNCFYQAA
ncbi:hypothetical protein L8W69_06400 [Campylobacter sp. CNRCH_2016_3089]|uniref:hypothetical protein n=1 Tax=Campylobacter TaxID=194 RepID=UPI002152698F|nr:MULTISPECIES: hypothetical protein [Campylobacter]MCR6520884.1 hypothetical protein [Campylobacter lari]MCV3508847.1 hypothetical protein [Campylobacter sp. CNRCH_2016_3089]